MRYRRLGRGRTALRVSTVCLGTMNFGPLTPEDEAHTIMDAALDHGINFFDTADRYGGDKGPGTTEEIIGRWFAQGKVVYVGTSNFAGWHIARACETAAQRHLLGPVSEQSLYNLTARTVELEVFPACREYGLGVIPWSPLAGGVLGGVLAAESQGRRASERIRRRVADLRPSLERYEGLCRDLGEEPAAVALAWLLHQDGVTAPIVGPRTLDQLEGASLRATELTLDEDTLSALDDIFPGPGGPAPEAYAW